MIVKNCSIQEVKEKYSKRHGFVFRGASPCNPKSAESVALIIKEKDISNNLPELVAQLNDRTFCFIYPENSYFKSGIFFEITNRLSMMFGVFEIDILNAFLKEN